MRGRKPRYLSLVAHDEPILEQIARSLGCRKSPKIRQLPHTTKRITANVITY